MFPVAQSRKGAIVGVLDRPNVDTHSFEDWGLNRLKWLRLWFPRDGFSRSSSAASWRMMSCSNGYKNAAEGSGRQRSLGEECHQNHPQHCCTKRQPPSRTTANLAAFTANSTLQKLYSTTTCSHNVRTVLYFSQFYPLNEFKKLAKERVLPFYFDQNTTITNNTHMHTYIHTNKYHDIHT